MTLAMLILAASASALGAPGPSDADVDVEIVRGIESLLDQVVVRTSVRYRNRSPGGPRVGETCGELLARDADQIRVRAQDGGEIDIPQADILRMTINGGIEPDPDGLNTGGPAALVAFALLTAGVEPEVIELDALLRTLERHELPGTYARGLRAAIWAKRIEQCGQSPSRLRYRRLLDDDVRWLIGAMKSNGYYSYERNGTHVDHSVTQFANLGMWAATDARAEVPADYWAGVEKHWLTTQQPDGGWTYAPRNADSKPSMTIAGANSLFLVLDHRYPRKERPYVRFKGAAVAQAIHTARMRLYEAIRRADDYLAANAPPMHDFFGYNLFGLERLGIASGRSQVGGQDWFRSNVASQLGRTWGADPVADAFALIFLVHGRAPVWIQKLEYGTDPRQCNRYHRDLHFLTRYLNRTFEKQHRWQVVQEGAGVESLRDAPILYISGEGPLRLSDSTLMAIREYLDGGGAVFLHADRAGVEFTTSAIRTFEFLYRDRGYQFRELPASHPAYTCYFGRGRTEWLVRPPLRGMSDGARDFILLCPVDIAGAWQQNRVKHEQDLFKIMVNVRTYLAPPYDELPPRLRPEPANSGDVTQVADSQATDKPSEDGRPDLRVARVRYDGPWDEHPLAWQHFITWAGERLPASLTVADVALDDAAGLEEFDILHLCIRGGAELSEAELSALKQWLARGGFLLIDAAGGSRDAIACARQVARSLGATSHLSLRQDHPIRASAFAGAPPLDRLRPTRWSASVFSAGLDPPIQTVQISGRDAVMLFPFDLVGGIDGAFVWGRVGYDTESSRRLLLQIIAWRLSLASGGGPEQHAATLSPP